MSEFSDLIIGPSDTITVEDWNDLVNNYHQLFLQRNNGLIISGLTVGRNSDQVTYQDTPQTTVGVSETNSDLRLQSPKRIMLHTNNKQEPNFAGKENNEMVGIFGDLVVHEAQSQGGRIYLGDYNHHIRCDFTKGITFSTYPNLDVMTIREGSGHVGIGTEDPQGKLHIVQDFQNPHGNSLVIGPTNHSNLRLGYDHNYTWIQSHGNKPLSINPLGKNVGIGTTNPENLLHLKSTIPNQGPESLKIETNFGWMKLGIRNSDWAHFYTDRPKYYFNKGLRVDSGEIGSYNSDLRLFTDNSERVTIQKSNGDVVVHGTLVVKGGIVLDGFNVIQSKAGEHIQVWGKKIWLKSNHDGSGGDTGVVASGGALYYEWLDQQ